VLSTQAATPPPHLHHTAAPFWHPLSRSKRVVGLRLSVDDSTFVMGKGVSTFANVAVMLGSEDFGGRHDILQGDRVRYAKRKPRASCTWGEGARNTKNG
jgi:hypothetical protein